MSDGPLYEIHEQFVDTKSAMHVLRLRRNTDGHEHLVQIFIGHDGCPACGHVRAGGDGAGLDPGKVVADVIKDLEASYLGMLDYAKKHKVPIRT
jgi:hypothetical protein